jgi:hypothetical protein
MSKKIVLVACVKEKRAEACPARDLYISSWFKKAARYAVQNADQWYILSAEYGLLNPNQVIGPYDTKLRSKGIHYRKAWAEWTCAKLKNHLKPGDKVVFLAGEAYREFLLGRISDLGYKIEIPMEGLGIGKQMHWLDQHTKED